MRWTGAERVLNPCWRGRRAGAWLWGAHRTQRPLRTIRNTKSERGVYKGMGVTSPDLEGVRRIGQRGVPEKERGEPRSSHFS